MRRFRQRRNQRRNNDDLSDSLEGGDNPSDSTAFRSIDTDGNGITDPMERCLPGMNYSINFQPIYIKTPDGWSEDHGTTGVCAVESGSAI